MVSKQAETPLLDVEIKTPEGLDDVAARILTPEAVRFVADLERTFRSARRAILRRREELQRQLDQGAQLDFPTETEAVRRGDWQVAPIPAPLQDRRVEITGPVDRKMMINALNSGARVFMADFEDATAPTWGNLLKGQANLIDAIEGTLAHDAPSGKHYRLAESTALLLVRPRGWHLPEAHFIVDGEPAAGALVDFGLYFFHNAQRLVDQGLGPYFYLPKLENHHEARLWNRVFEHAQERLGLPSGTIKATVLIETILAALEMDEILYELRDHIVGFNAGRWDYIFSAIKKFRTGQEPALPDRAQITMTVPFMRAYTELLVKTCHRRGAHAIGGMAAFVPNRRDPEVTAQALAKVREDKEREAGDGFDGTWVAHPDLVPVALEIFDRTLGDRPHQKERLREEVAVTARDLLDLRIPDGTITEAGLRNNITVAVQYIAAWLGGAGAVNLDNLMEDTATAEIARSQLWQWVHRDGVRLDDGREVTAELYRALAAEEQTLIETTVGAQRYAAGRYDTARELLDRLVLPAEFSEFLTLPAYATLIA